MKNRKIWLALLLVLSLMLCLLPATALAAGGHDAAAQEEAAVAAEAEEAAEDAEEEAAPAEDAVPEEAEDADEPADEAGEEDPGAAAFLVPPAEDAYVVERDETYFAMPGEIVYNNGGIVYANESTVYNNTGLVYANGGTVYNNAGTVYANGGLVYNNTGAVYSNKAVVYCFEGSVEESVIYGYYRVTLSEGLAAYAEITGLSTLEDSDGLFVTPDSVLEIRAKEGYEIVELTADAGELNTAGEGVYTLVGVASALNLDAVIRPAAPVLSLAPGTYGEAQTLSIEAVEGAEIYYSLDGKTPDVENSELYEGPISLDEGAVVTALAVVKGLDFSEAAQGAYAIVALTAPEFEAVDEGYAQPAAQAITAVNAGTVDAVITEVSISGEGAEAFTLSGSTRGAAIKAGTDGDTQWKLRPAAGLERGRYNAVVSFTFDSGEIVELTVSFRVK